MGRPALADRPDPEADLLVRLASQENRIAAGDAVAVFAHPDDETIGLGAQLPRLHGLTLVHVTDGAPRAGGAAAEHGFADPASYAAARRRELEAALDLAGIGPDALVAFDVPDQEVCLDLAGLSQRLAHLFAERGIRTVLTHAYEGGHPDHDGVAFAVRAAARLHQGRTGRPVDVLEMPFYHWAGTGSASSGDDLDEGISEGDCWRVQRFAPGPGGPELVLRLTPEQQALKRRMLAAHRSQGGVLARVDTDTERFRRAPAHDFAALPNGGRLLYERYGWGVTGRRFLALAAEASRTLGLGP